MITRCAIARLNPGYFAMVMGTGIVSIAAHKLGYEIVARLLFFFNIAAYLALCALSTARLVIAREDVIRDLADHMRGPAFLTLSAGSCVLGSQFVLLLGWVIVPTALWAVGALSWLLLVYGFLTAVTVIREKPDLPKGINGAWLLIIVATQSLTILGSLLAEEAGMTGRLIEFALLSNFLLGCMFYVLIMTLIFYRFIFFRLDPEELKPPYWVNMGVEAITALTAVTLVSAAAGSTLLRDLEPVLRATAIMFWITATWWIPLLVLLGIWRHITRRIPICYEPSYWSMVFPLGMYSASSYELAGMVELEVLTFVSEVFVWIALVALLLCLGGLIRSAIR